MEPQGDRRASRRFPIQQEVHFRAARGHANSAGCGTTLNISSGGVLFTTDRSLPEGSWLVLEIQWPVLLDRHKPIKLVTHGKVVRCEDCLAAVRFREWEFRTIGNHQA